jgi:plastocyanin
MILSRLAAATAMMLLLAAPAAAQAPAQFIVQLYSFGFGPQPIHLAAGRPVTLTFTNSSGSSHDFTAPGFFARSRIIAGAAPAGKVELRPHETRSITLVPAAGTWQAHCSHFFHAQMGMTDTIVVN